MSRRRRGLGRGLGSLLPVDAEATLDAAGARRSNRPQPVPAPPGDGSARPWRSWPSPSAPTGCWSPSSCGPWTAVTSWWWASAAGGRRSRRA